MRQLDQSSMGVKGDDCFMGCRRPFPIGAWVNVWRNCFSRPAAKAITNVCNSKKAGGWHQNFKTAVERVPASPARAYFFCLALLLSQDQKKNKEKSPADRWKRGGFHQRSASRFNDLILEGLNNG